MSQIQILVPTYSVLVTSKEVNVLLNPLKRKSLVV
jgi:hypothetical protein